MKLICEISPLIQVILVKIALFYFVKEIFFHQSTLFIQLMDEQSE